MVFLAELIGEIVVRCFGTTPFAIDCVVCIVFASFNVTDPYPAIFIQLHPVEHQFHQAKFNLVGKRIAVVFYLNAPGGRLCVSSVCMLV